MGVGGCAFICTQTLVLAISKVCKGYKIGNLQVLLVNSIFVGLKVENADFRKAKNIFRAYGFDKL